MEFRLATLSDIQAMHTVRMSVKENVLSNPALVTTEDYERFVTAQGKGWVCEVDKEIVGFAIVDVTQNNIWALFVSPEHEMKGIGSKLHDIMLNWFFANYKEALSLSTEPNTRAEKFYKLRGWIENGRNAGGETMFEMSYNNWCGRNSFNA